MANKLINEEIKHLHESKRRELWCNAWVATASSSNCTKSSSCTAFADEALKQFDERFKISDLLLNE